MLGKLVFYTWGTGFDDPRNLFLTQVSINKPRRIKENTSNLAPFQFRAARPTCSLCFAEGCRCSTCSKVRSTMGVCDVRSSSRQQHSHQLFGLHCQARLVAGGMLVPMLDYTGPAAGRGLVQASYTRTFNPNCHCTP